MISHEFFLFFIIKLNLLWHSVKVGDHSDFSHTSIFGSVLIFVTVANDRFANMTPGHMHIHYL